MHIDRTQRVWAIWTVFLFLFAALTYSLYAFFSRGPLSGGSIPGLVFGSAGYGLMIYAALLSLRKKFPIWRVGRAQTWMRGHLWLGLLSYPLILFHATFSFGSSGFTRGMMWVFTLVIVTGLLGVALQHYMPRMMTDRVPMETIYNQIPRVQKQLLQEADELFSSLTEKKNEYGLQVPAVGQTGIHTTTTTLVRVDVKAAMQLQQSYVETIRPYLAQPGAYRHGLNDRRTSKALFIQLRTLTPESVKPVIDDLENVCEEKRDLDRQSRLHRILYSWLLVHVPLSFLLIILGAIHAVMALRYS
ncbi:MAG TPA: hypothetical protein VK738_10680 [Terriglobales bacterium]|nr:hypothetical protein [Terriglobales bacterium]